jgi:hypothetical protein
MSPQNCLAIVSPFWIGSSPQLDEGSGVFRAELTMGKASLVLGVSEPQCYRIKARVKQQGVKGVVDGNRRRQLMNRLLDGPLSIRF